MTLELPLPLEEAVYVQAGAGATLPARPDRRKDLSRGGAGDIRGDTTMLRFLVRKQS